ncbi:MAG: glutathione S-transferase family protein, partial [Polyangiales bacterium]
DYKLVHVDLTKREQKADAFVALNKMGKVPTIQDGEVVVSETAAIAMYLADRYALGRLAPLPDDPKRGAYFRWIAYAPSVIEPGCLAQRLKLQVDTGAIGWGSYADMLDTITGAIGDGPWLLGNDFSMADIVFGGTVRWMVMFGMLEKRPEYLAYIERLNARPAAKKARELDDEFAAKHEKPA